MKVETSKTVETSETVVPREEKKITSGRARAMVVWNRSNGDRRSGSCGTKAVALNYILNYKGQIYYDDDT